MEFESTRKYEQKCIVRRRK